MTVLLTLGALGAAPALAHASATQESLFMDDNRLMYRSEKVSDATVEQLARLGVDRIRLSVVWRNIAPGTRPAGFDGSDPGDYTAASFDAHDHVLRVARRHGIEVLFNVVGPAPAWASGTRLAGDRKPAGGTVRPSPVHFARFMQMLGRRYGGEYKDENQGAAALPRVTVWSIWNEPNRGANLAPQWQRNKRTRKWRAVGPRHYRRMFRAATDALAKAGHGDDLVLLGETAPLGSRPRTVRSHMKPIVFLRELFCLRAKDFKPYTGATARKRGCDFARRGPLKVGGYAHHPYSVTSAPGTVSSDPDVAMLADGNRLSRVLDAAKTARRLTAGVPLWYTEHGYQTRPPDPIRGVTLAEQAAWNSEAERITRADPRIAAHSQFLLRDDEPIASFPASDPRYWGTYQTGLEFVDGTPKPALNAYRLPLAVVGKTLWGLVRPLAEGDPRTVRIQYRNAPDAAWRDLRELDVDANRAWALDLGAGAQAGEYRFLWPLTPPPPRGILDPLAPPPPPPAPFVSEPVTVAP